MAQATLRPLKIKVEEIMAVKLPGYLIRFETKSGLSITASVPSTLMLTGSSATSCFTASGIPGNGQTKAEQFLSHLAVDRNVAASTQNQALSAILFLYKEVLEQDIGWLENVEQAKRPARLPVVLTATEVRAVLAHLEGRYRLMANLLYGAGLRDGMRPLAVKDLDFEYRQITVRDGKGQRPPDDATGRPARTAPDPFGRCQDSARARFA